MDEKDKKILELLKEDSSSTTRKIAKKTLIPITTVHKRIKKLKENNIIKRYTVDLNYSKLDRGLAAVILATLKYDILKEKNIIQQDLARKIQSLDVVEKTFHVTGGTDMVVIIRVKDTPSLENFLDMLKKKFDAINTTQTLVVLSET